MYSETFIKIYDNILSGKLSKYSKYNHPSIYIHVSTIISYIYGVGALSSRKVLQSVVYATIGILVFTAWNIVMQFCTRVFTYTVSTKHEYKYCLSLHMNTFILNRPAGLIWKLYPLIQNRVYFCLHFSSKSGRVSKSEPWPRTALHFLSTRVQRASPGALTVEQSVSKLPRP